MDALCNQQRRFVWNEIMFKRLKNNLTFMLKKKLNIYASIENDTFNKSITLCITVEMTTLTDCS